MHKILLLSLLIPVTACTARGSYESLQISRRNECMKLPQARYDECMEGVRKSYDEYESERQEYLKEREEYKKEEALEEMKSEEGGEEQDL